MWYQTVKGVFAIMCVRNVPPAVAWAWCPTLWRPSSSRLLLIWSSSLCGSGLSRADRSSPSWFHVLNWKRTEKPPIMEDGVGAGRDRKLLLELRKEQDTS